MSDAYGFYLGQPWWLLAGVAVIPMIWLARRHLAALGAVRRIAAIALRTLVVLVLVLLLARPMLIRKSRRATVIAVLDRSQSIPAELGQAALDYLSQAVAAAGENQLAVVDVAETASIAKLPSTDTEIRRRNTDLTGRLSRLADGVQMAMAIAPPDTGTRIVLVTEGNETDGDLKEVAETAAANGIPIDVLPLRYRYEDEVLLRRVVAPPRVRRGQTIALRLLLDSTGDVRGKLLVTRNDEPIDLVPDSPEVAMPVALKAGINVKTFSIAAGTRGVSEFEAVFMADEPGQDRIVENNRASTITCVAGPGYVRVFDTDGIGERLADALQQAGINTTRSDVAELPTRLAHLLDADAIVLVNTPVHQFTMAQQEMLCRYVKNLGGGLVMVGGPDSFGAGGWIGSPVADLLPVDLDPPQKKQLPLGALVLVIDHSGSMTGEKIEICKAAAAGAVRLLSRRDLVGIVTFEAVSEWLSPLGPAGDKTGIHDGLGAIGAGGGTVMAPAMGLAFEALQDVQTSVRHVILLTDGQTAEPEACAKVGAEMGAAGVTISTVAVGAEAHTQLLQDIADGAGGRFYPVSDPWSIPEIFIKEAQIVRRQMIIERNFAPQVVYALSEIVGGAFASLPPLDGYVLTGPKGGLNQLILSSPEEDPVLATCQSGLGRCVAFTSSVDSRWAASWVQWPGFSTFWEQVIRWVGKPTQSADCEIFTDVDGGDAMVHVEAYDEEGRFLQFATIEGQVLTPAMETEPLLLSQAGPGQYAGRFRVSGEGSYIVNLQYRKAGSDGDARLSNAIVTVPFAPEFRDLVDNMPLLEEVSRITGGRILAADPNQADLYSYAGVTFPQTHLPLVKPLMLAWIVLFLLDVAVRRVVLDVRAAARKVRNWMTAARGRPQEQQTIGRLRARRQKLRDQWSSRAAETASTKRYVGARRQEDELPSLDAERAVVGPEPEKPPEPKPSKTSSEGTHIDALLRAKRRKAGRDE